MYAFHVQASPRHSHMCGQPWGIRQRLCQWFGYKVVWASPESLNLGILFLFIIHLYMYAFREKTFLHLRQRKHSALLSLGDAQVQDATHPLHPATPRHTIQFNMQPWCNGDSCLWLESRVNFFEGFGFYLGIMSTITFCTFRSPVVWLWLLICGLWQGRRPLWQPLKGFRKQPLLFQTRSRGYVLGFIWKRSFSNY